MGMTSSTNARGVLSALALSIAAAASIALAYLAGSPSPAQFNTSIGQKLSTLTDNWDRLSVAQGGALPTSSADVKKLALQEHGQVATNALASIYEDCNALRSTERSPLDNELYPSYVKQRNEVAQACSTMARLVASNAFTYEQFREIAMLQRKHHDAAAVLVETERKQALAPDAKEKQQAAAARQNMLALQSWREQED